MTQVYLAGPITSLTFGEAQNWRDYAIEKLQAHGIKGISPLRGQQHLVRYGELSATGDGTYAEHALTTAKAITTRDRYDCQRADVVLMNLLGATRVSIGTMIEAGWADSVRVPLIVVIEDDNVHQHALLREIAGYVVNDLDAAIGVAISILK